MKTVKYEISVFMETEDYVSDIEARHLFSGAKDAMQRFVESVWAEIGLDNCSLIEGRLIVDGVQKAKVYGKEKQVE